MEVPWSVGIHKQQFKIFAHLVAVMVPNAIFYETPKLWTARKPDKSPLDLRQMLAHPVLLREAFCELSLALQTSRRQVQPALA